MKKRNNFFALSESRDVLFGIAIWGIMIFHLITQRRAYLGADSWIIRILNQGVIGVEIFLFLSGIGLYFSMKKDENFLRYLKRRLVRIVIPCLLILPIYFFFFDVVMQDKADRFWPDVTLYSFFADGSTKVWFIGAILVFYLIFPLIFQFFKLAQRCSPKSREIVSFLQLLVLLALSVGLTYSVKTFLPEVYGNINLMLTRLPVFIVGAYFGRLVYEKKNAPWWFAVLMAAVLALKVYLTVTDPYERYRLVDGAVAVALCYYLSLLIQAVNLQLINKFFIFFGKMSLELYVIHLAIRDLCRIDGNFEVYSCWRYAVILGFAILFSWVVKTAGDKLTANFNSLCERHGKGKNAALTDRRG